MALISLRQVSVQYGGPTVLDAININIESDHRACITGRNGEGKSTLLKIIAGIIKPDSGEIIRQPGLRVATLSQDVPDALPGTVTEVVEQLNEESDHTHHNPDAARFIDQLGLDGDAPFATLSGGMRRRALLARALAQSPHLLLLDEPTNHLDIQAIEWLEGFLQRQRLACLFVTHDRAFLKQVAKQVLDLDRGQLAGWDCDYLTFIRRKQELLNDEAVYWQRQTKKLVKEEAWLRRGVKARTTRNEGRVASLMALRETFKSRRNATGVSRLQLDLADASGEQILKIRDVTFGYPGEAPLIRDLTATVLRGERIGIIGANGSGKTTLLNLLCGRLTANQGSITLGARVEIAYFDQLRGQLNIEKTVQENVAEDREEVVICGVRKHIYGYLGDFLFTPDRARTPVKALSGGERARLLLAKLFLQPGNLLVMDEPTNDLDIETLELLEEQLLNYNGTLLLVSHDRSFIDNVVTSTFVLPGDGTVERYPGGYSDWLSQRPQPALSANDANKEKQRQDKTARKQRERLSYKEKRQLDMLPEQITALESEIHALREQLGDAELYRKTSEEVAAVTARLPAAEAELEKIFARWADLEARTEITP